MSQIVGVLMCLVQFENINDTFSISLALLRGTLNSFLRDLILIKDLRSTSNTNLGAEEENFIGVREPKKTGSLGMTWILNSSTSELKLDVTKTKLFLSPLIMVIFLQMIARLKISLSPTSKTFSKINLFRMNLNFGTIFILYWLKKIMPCYICLYLLLKYLLLLNN